MRSFGQIAFEALDDSLSTVQLIDREREEASVPEHDLLYLKKAEEVEDQKKKDAEVPEDTPMDGDPEEVSSDDVGSDEEPDGEEEVKDGEEVVAQESLRSERYQVILATEAFLEEGSMSQKALSFGWEATKGLSSFALKMATELGSVLKGLGIAYGPVVFKRLRSGVMYILERLLKNFYKFRVSLAQNYVRRKHSLQKSQVRIQRLLKTLEELKDEKLTLTKPEPFRDEELFDWFLSNDELSITKSIASVKRLMGVVTTEIDQALSFDLGTIERLIDLTKRGVRTNLASYLDIQFSLSNFKRDTTLTSDEDREILDSYRFNDTLPNYTLLSVGIPKKDVIRQYGDGDNANVVKAYHDSYFALVPCQYRIRSIPNINYVDQKQLEQLLKELSSLCSLALEHVEFYKKFENKAEKLKTDYQHYFNWLTSDEQAKSLNESLSELIYLKQQYISRVYLPGAMDIHDYVALYLTKITGYAEKNLKALQPAVKTEQPS